jgi:hypothetical protein
MTAFTAGWLENQSIWLHMSYKFYLQLIKGGLYEEFFSEVKTGLVPFMDQAVYGRSPLEASSFLVSSAFPNRKLHGTGFQARLSGSTAEMLSIWAEMFIGSQPFTHSTETEGDGGGISSSGLALEFKPVLPGWLFKADNTVTFTFLGSTRVTYHNPLRANTWQKGMQAVKLVLTDVHGSITTVPGSVLPEELAVLVRQGEVQAINVYYPEKE